MPATHGGRSFRFTLTFSEHFDFSYRLLRDAAFTVTGGRIVGAKRQRRGSNIGWEITIRPRTRATSTETVSETVAATLPANRPCNETGALCTADGRRLTTEVTVSVPRS